MSRCMSPRQSSCWKIPSSSGYHVVGYPQYPLVMEGTASVGASNLDYFHTGRWSSKGCSLRNCRLPSPVRLSGNVHYPIEMTVDFRGWGIVVVVVWARVAKSRNCVRGLICLPRNSLVVAWGLWDVRVIVFVGGHGAWGWVFVLVSGAERRIHETVENVVGWSSDEGLYNKEQPKRWKKGEAGVRQSHSRSYFWADLRNVSNASRAAGAFHSALVVDLNTGNFCNESAIKYIRTSESVLNTVFNLI